MSGLYNKARGMANKSLTPTTIPNELSSDKIVLGTVVGVYEMWAGAVILDGPVVEIIEAGATPPARVHLEHHFRAQNLATSLKKVSIPTKPSKYRRYIIQRRPGRCFVYPENPASYRFVVGVTKDER